MRCLLTAAFCLLLSAVSVSAQQAPTAPQTAVEGFAPIAFMAGSCWSGPLPNFVADSLGVGERAVVHCVRWRLGGRLLTDTLHIDGMEPAEQGETNYYWDAEAKVLRYIHWSTGDPYSFGTMKWDGTSMIFDDERLIGGSRGPVQFVTTWTQTGEDAFDQVRRRKNADGTWTDTAKSTFERQPLR